MIIFDFFYWDIYFQNVYECDMWSFIPGTESGNYSKIHTVSIEHECLIVSCSQWKVKAGQRHNRSFSKELIGQNHRCECSCYVTGCFDVYFLKMGCGPSSELHLSLKFFPSRVSLWTQCKMLTDWRGWWSGALSTDWTKHFQRWAHEYTPALQCWCYNIGSSSNIFLTV